MRTRLTLLAIVVLCAMKSPAVAQQQVFEGFVMPRNEETESQRRQQRKQYLTKLIERMDEVLELTDAQLQRLRVACKGAVEYSFQDSEAERNQTADVNRRFAPLVRPPVIRFDNAPRRAVRGAVLFTSRGHDAAVAARHPIWTNTIERMFTEEEVAKIKSLEREQLKQLDPRQLLREENNAAVQRLLIEQLNRRRLLEARQ